MKGGSIYTDEERKWLEQRAREIFEERGWALPIAQSEATAELTRSIKRTRNELIAQKCLCLPVRYPDWDEGTMCTRCHDLLLIEPPSVSRIDARIGHQLQRKPCVTDN